MIILAYVRYAAKLDKNMDPEFIKAIYKLANEINYIGHNINQVVKNNNINCILKLTRQQWNI